MNRKSYRLLTVLFSIRFFRRKKNTLLIVKLDAIGDYILFRNYLKTIAGSEKYKNHSITLCGSEIIRPIAETFDKENISNFIGINHKRKFEFWYCLKLFIAVQKMGFETVINPVYSRDNWSDLFVRATGATQRIGYDGDFTNISFIEKQRNSSCYTRYIAGGEPYLFEFYRNGAFISAILDINATLPLKTNLQPAFIGSSRTGIVICPGSGQAHKIWPAERFAEITSFLTTYFKGEGIVLCGGPGEIGIGKKIVALGGNTVLKNLIGQTNLIDLVNLISKAKLVICNDSSAYHIAVATDTPVVCISNGENYGRFSPYPKALNLKSEVVYPDKLDTILDENVRLIKFCRTVNEVSLETIPVSKVRERILKLNLS